MILLATKHYLLYNTNAFKIKRLIGDSMSKIKVNFNLKTEDEHQAFIAQGIKTDDTLFFHDDLGFKHKLLIQSDAIEYHKKGETNLMLTFQENHRHKGSYQVMNHTLTFDVLTDKLDIKEDSIYIQYRLLINSELAHRANLSIEYSMLEEDKHGRN